MTPAERPAADERYVWSKWFWTDWRADAGIEMVSWAARGLWMECLALMAKSEQRGYLLVAGRMPNDKTLLRLTRGASARELRRCMEELTQHQVCSWTDEGVMYSRRMVRDAATSARNSANGKNGGNPALLDKPPVKAPVKPPVKRTPQALELEARSQSQKPESAAPPAPTRDLMSLFSTLHENRFETPAPFSNDRDAKILAEVWQRHGDKTEPLIRLFFQSRDPYVLTSGFSVPVFKGQVSRLIPRLPTTKGTTAEHWRDECSRLHQGGCEKQWQHDERMKASA